MQNWQIGWMYSINQHKLNMFGMAFGWLVRNPHTTDLEHNRVFPKLTDLTFLLFLYKIDIMGFQNQQKKIALPLGIELTTPTPLL